MSRKKRKLKSDQIWLSKAKKKIKGTKKEKKVKFTKNDFLELLQAKKLCNNLCKEEIKLNNEEENEKMIDYMLKEYKKEYP